MRGEVIVGTGTDPSGLKSSGAKDPKELKEVKQLEEKLQAFEENLIREEKSPATCEKYLREARGFLLFVREGKGNGRGIDDSRGKDEIVEACRRIDSSRESITEKRRNREKSIYKRKEKGRLEVSFIEDMLISYKKKLIDESYSPSTVNGKLAAIRSFLSFLGVEDVHIKNVRVQHSPYISEKKLLTREEYKRLLAAASKEKGKRMKLILETLCATGMRVSELSFITVEAAEEGETRINLKGKTRRILICDSLRKKLLRYARAEGISEGCIFLNSKGSPLHRSYVWQAMKALAKKAGVEAGKVFPHNLRRLFARSFYKAKKDIAKLADILGHSSIDTTRIYIATTAHEHIREIEKLKLVT